MAVTQSELALQMLAQLRVLDPSVSAEVGTPERKILDTVAQALSDSQVDLTQLSGALDIDAKYGANLDRFLGLFGFGRQQAVRATGFVTLTREVASTLDIRIPLGTQLMLPPDEVTVGADGHANSPVYETVFEVSLLAGTTSISVPVRAVIPGIGGNLEAGRHLQFVGSPVFGITDRVNELPITGGVDAEDDDQLKTRFKNTVFRNLAGTQDQYMALAAATAFTTKANVVGPISRYREYIEVPAVDDAGSYDVDPAESLTDAEYGNGNSGEWTTALSTIPYSKFTYDMVPNFVSNGQTGTRALFYREETDWRINTTPSTRNRGDAYRLAHADVEPDVDPLDPETSFRPNVTFLNVYTGSDDAVEAVRPRDIVLFEHSYMSTASRNDYLRNVSNAVDVFIDGSNDTPASTVITTPGTITSTAFVGTTTSKYYTDNYRRVGDPDQAPTIGHLLVPLFWQPVTGLPAEITVATEGQSSTFYLNEHYWLVEDNTELYGTVRCRNGIEWDANTPGSSSPLSSDRSGLKLNEFARGISISVNGYLFDKNVVDLQGILEAQKQVTTDVLVHRARRRYFKLDITVMYASGYSTALVNDDIRSAVSRYMSVQYFGNAVQLSDLLSVIHSVPGVDNVRWTVDTPGAPDAARVQETNADGVTRVDGIINNDFFLHDDELPTLAQGISTDDQTRADAREFAVLPGLVIRARAQNTWIKR